jgi:hypothetical protein
MSLASAASPREITSQERRSNGRRGACVWDAHRSTRTALQQAKPHPVVRCHFGGGVVSLCVSFAKHVQHGAEIGVEAGITELYGLSAREPFKADRQSRSLKLGRPSPRLAVQFAPYGSVVGAGQSGIRSRTRLPSSDCTFRRIATGHSSCSCLRCARISTRIHQLPRRPANLLLRMVAEL